MSTVVNVVLHSCNIVAISHERNELELNKKEHMYQGQSSS